jgi:hypothetical protein
MPQLLAYHGNHKTCGWKLSCHKIDSLFCDSKSVLGQISFIAYDWRLSIFCIVVETVLMFHTLWLERDLDFVFSPNFKIWFTLAERQGLWIPAVVSSRRENHTYRNRSKRQTPKQIQHVGERESHGSPIDAKRKQEHAKGWRVLLQNYSSRTRCNKNMSAREGKQHTNARTSHWQCYIYTYITYHIFLYTYLFLAILFAHFFNSAAIFQTYIHKSNQKSVAVSFQNDRNIMVFVFPTYVGSNASNVKNIEKMRITITSKIYSPD